MEKNNYPTASLNGMAPTAVTELVTSLKQLHDEGRPETDKDLEKRINDYFSFCEQSAIRPGIESLCLALHISRTTLFRWSKGEDCSERRQELVLSAKAFISAFIEQAMLSGKINPASGIFLMKNWLNYKDTVSLEEATPEGSKGRALSVDQLPKLSEFREAKIGSMGDIVPSFEDEE